VKVTEKPDGTVEVDTGAGAAKATAKYDPGEGGILGVLVKSDGEKRETLTVAYPADRADTTRAADGHRDFASREALEKAAHSFLANSPNVGRHHAEGTDGSGTVLESFLWPAGDWTPEGSCYTVREGDWLVKVRWSEDAWAEIKAGLINGVSMQGRARRRKPSAEAVAALRS
jgi:Putative phage serine protease XkdF